MKRAHVIAVSCGEVDEKDVAARYVAGSLTPALREAFEIHLLECPRCLGEVELATAIRRATPRIAARDRKSAGRGRRRVAAILVAAAAAAAFALLVRPDDSAVRALGRIDEAPLYLGVRVRSTAPGDSLFTRALSAYNRGAWPEAAAGLRAALAAGAPAIPATFFLGASLLMQERHADAAAAFTIVVESGSSPYADDARLYRARAALATGDVRAARRDLERIESEGGPLAPAAARLLAAVRSAVR